MKYPRPATVTMKLRDRVGEDRRLASMFARCLFIVFPTVLSFLLQQNVCWYSVHNRPILISSTKNREVKGIRFPPHRFLVVHGIFLDLWVSSSDDDYGDQPCCGCASHYEV